MKPDGQNSIISFVISKWLLLESLVFRPLVKGNEDSGNEIGSSLGFVVVVVAVLFDF